jgi:hypothetical protein
MHVSSTARRVAAAAVAAAGLVATVGAVAQAAPTSTAATTKAPAAGAAGWLARQLTGPHHDHLVAFGSAQAGATADAVLAFDAAHVAQRAAVRATSWLRSDAGTYTAAGGPAGTRDPGALAKLLLVAEAQRVDPHRFGGLDLIAQLRADEQPDGAFAPGGDAATENLVSQSLALIALSHTGSVSDWPDAKAIAWTVGQQCADGGFQYTPQATTAATCSDVDTTGLVAQGLLTVHSSAAAGALGWLRRHRNYDGGWGSDFQTGKPLSNANSTAVAVQALLQAGGSGHSGLAWLRLYQVHCNGKASRIGSVRYVAGAWSHDSVVFATVQAAQALAHRWLGDMSNRGAQQAAPVLTGC